MSSWAEEISQGPLREIDFVKMGCILGLNDSHDSLSPRAVEMAEQRVAFLQGALRHSTQKVVAEFTAGATQKPGESHE